MDRTQRLIDGMRLCAMNRTMVDRWYTNAKDAQMFKGADGPLVLYSDYDALEERCKQLEAALAAMTEDRDAWYFELRGQAYPKVGIAHHGCVKGKP